MVWTRNSEVWMPWNDGSCCRIKDLLRGSSQIFLSTADVIMTSTCDPQASWNISLPTCMYTTLIKKYQSDDWRWMVVYFLLPTSVPVYGRLHASIFHVKSVTADNDTMHGKFFLWTAPSSLVWGPSLPPILKLCRFWVWQASSWVEFSSHCLSRVQCSYTEVNDENHAQWFCSWVLMNRVYFSPACTAHW